MTGRLPTGLVGGLALVLLGGVLGIAADRLVSGRTPSALTPLEAHELMLADFRDRLGLDEAQVDEIDSIFRRHQRAVETSWQEIQPHLRSAIDSVHRHMERILRPDQREAFREWVAEQVESTPGRGGDHAERHRPPD